MPSRFRNKTCSCRECLQKKNFAFVLLCMRLVHCSLIERFKSYVACVWNISNSSLFVKNILKNKSKVTQKNEAISSLWLLFRPTLSYFFDRRLCTNVSLQSWQRSSQFHRFTSGRYRKRSFRLRRIIRRRHYISEKENRVPPHPKVSIFFWFEVLFIAVFCTRKGLRLAKSPVIFSSKYVRYLISFHGVFECVFIDSFKIVYL